MGVIISSPERSRLGEAQRATSIVEPKPRLLCGRAKGSACKGGVSPRPCRSPGERSFRERRLCSRHGAPPTLEKHSILLMKRKTSARAAMNTPTADRKPTASAVTARRRKRGHTRTHGSEHTDRRPTHKRHHNSNSDNKRWVSVGLRHNNFFSSENKSKSRKMEKNTKKRLEDLKCLSAARRRRAKAANGKCCRTQHFRSEWKREKST